jgi:hypothetical protein
MPYKKGEFFFETHNFILDVSEYEKYKNKAITYQNNVHVKYQSPKVRKAKMVLYDSVLVVFFRESSSTVSQQKPHPEKIEIFKL